MTVKSVLMRSQGLRPGACAPTCPPCYATATLQIHPTTELQLTHINDTHKTYNNRGARAELDFHA